MNSTYKPTTTEDKALFEVKQTYMFAVFEKTLLTDQGKAYVREYEKESDAHQSIYRRISKYAIKSTKASLEASTILSYITSCKPQQGHHRYPYGQAQVQAQGYYWTYHVPFWM
jgi:hypothetical protein